MYNVPAQETVKHCAKFGWHPVSDVGAVTKPRWRRRKKQKVTTAAKYNGLPVTIGGHKNIYVANDVQNR